MRINKTFLTFPVIAIALFAAPAVAVCPVCTIAVSAGVGLSRWLGVDDLITGLWLGGAMVSLIMWTLNWMDKKAIAFKGKALITIALYFLLIFAPLYFTDILGDPDNQLLGLDKLVLGTLAGSVAFYAGAWWYQRLKARNNGHAYFPFQKVVMPILPLILLNLLFYFLLPQG